jgi:hypothetical protein
MIVKKQGLINHLFREWGWLYNKREISTLIEEKGAASFDPSIKYLNFGEWEIPTTTYKKTLEEHKNKY